MTTLATMRAAVRQDLHDEDAAAYRWTEHRVAARAAHDDRRDARLARPLGRDALASGATTYTYGGAHPLRSLSLRSTASPVSEAETFGLAAFGEAIDYATAEQSLGVRESLRDLSSTTGATAAATAAAHLRQRALDAAAGQLVAPPNCGQELLDAVDFTDALVAATATKRRVASIRWRFDKRRAVYEQTLELGAM